MPRTPELVRLLAESGALEEGHFVLSSGLHSKRYVQCALLLEDPTRARRLGAWLGERLAPHRPESIAAPALGGLIIGHEVAAALGLPFRFTERREGEMVLRRGFRLRRGERVAVVEDVVTTGRSSGECAAALRREGGEVAAIGSIIDRSGGRSPFAEPFVSLLALELEVFAAGDCPLCRSGDAPRRPGSRPEG